MALTNVNFHAKQNLKVSVIFFCLIIIEGCGKSVCQIPKINLPWEVTQFEETNIKKYPDTREGAWFFHLQIAEIMHQKTELTLQKSQKLFYRFLTSKQKEKIIAQESLEKKITEQTLIEESTEQKIFLAITALSPEERISVRDTWAELLQAEYINAMSAVIIAQLRQQWERKKNCLTTSHPDIKKIKLLLDKLPTLEELESKKKNILTLQTSCQQLAIANEEIPIPSWEDNVNSSIIVKEIEK